MRLNRLFFSFLFSILTLIGRAQSDPFAGSKIPTTIPVSPEAFAMTKFGDVPVGLFTGTAQFSVPVFEVVSRKIQFPVKLNYATNGVKVDEVASRVGMGWSLQAGGVITRKTLGLPDGIAGSSFVAAPDEDIHSTAFYNFLKNSVGSNYDTQPDEYSYSFNGYQGSFVLINDVVKQIKKSSLRIEKTGTTKWTFLITTPDGTKYYFGEGSAYEEAESYNYQSPADGRAQLKRATTGWYLSKIVDPTLSDSVFFSYTRLPGGQFVDYFTGITQENLIYGDNGWVTNTTGIPGGGDLPACNEGNMLRSIYVKSKMYPAFLDAILYNNGEVRFTYSQREDLINDKRIDTIAIYPRNALAPKQFVLLKYEYANSFRPGLGAVIGNGSADVTDLQKRLFLTSVNYLDTAGDTADVYGFEYDNMHSLPPRLSFSQDHTGYFNLKQNNFFFPATWYFEDYDGNPIGGNRLADSVAVKNGVLTKIVYPTGGSTVLEYEPNRTFAEYYNKLTYEDSSFTCSLGSGPIWLTSSVDFFANDKTLVHLVLAGGWNGPAPDPSMIRGDEAVLVTLTNLDNGTNVFANMTVTPGEEKVMRYNRTLDGNYRLTISKSHLSVAGSATVLARKDVTLPPGDEILGGVRVKRVIDYDNNNFANGKEYEYIVFGDTISSESLYNIDFVLDNYLSMGRKLGNVSGGGIENNTYCYYNILSSSGLHNLYLSDYATCGYRNVTEYSIDSLGNRVGGKEYEFNISRKGLAQPLATTFPNTIYQYSPFRINGAQMTNSDTLNGQEVYQGSFVIENDIKKFRQKIYQYHSVDTNSYVSEPFYVSRQTLNRDNYTLGENYFFDFDVNRYYRNYFLTHLDSVRTISYYDDQADSTIVLDMYEYNSLNIALPSLKENWYSPTLSTRIQYKYVSDLVSTNPVLGTMKSRNMLDEVIESDSYKNGSLMFSERNEFDKFDLNGNVIKIKKKTIQKAGESIKATVNFSRYDSYGNLLEVNKNDDIKQFYIWNPYSNTLAAQYVNADYNEIGYSSFEEGAGNLTVVSGGVSSAGGITGEKSFSGALSFSMQLEKSYRITVWNKTGTTVTINSQPGTVLLEINGWQLRQWEFTNIGSVIISGSQIDEVRILPVGAVLTSYTYGSFLKQTSSCDPNNTITYYSYDNFGRLIFIRDQYQHIVKRICYNYAGQTEPCKFFYNEEKSQSFSRSNCGPGYQGGTYTYHVPAGKYIGDSQAAADSLAMIEMSIKGQHFADSLAECLLLYYNEFQSQQFLKNNCKPGLAAKDSFLYTVPANKYTSTISQTAANQFALDEIASEGQLQANQLSSCHSYFTNSESLMGTFIRNNCPAPLGGTEVFYVLEGGTIKSFISQAHADSLALVAFQINGQAEANTYGACLSCTPLICTGVDRKCVNGVCEIGVEITTSCLSLGGGMWERYFHYKWSDGSISETHTSIQTTRCVITPP